MEKRLSSALRSLLQPPSHPEGGHETTPHLKDPAKVSRCGYYESHVWKLSLRKRRRPKIVLVDEQPVSCPPALEQESHRPRLPLHHIAQHIAMMTRLNLARAAVVMSAVFSVTSSQELFFGSCPQQAVVQNFDLNSYLGKWYEIEKYFAIFELGGKCITAEYSLLPSGNIKVVNSQANAVTGKATSIEGQAVLADPASVGGAPSGGDGNYWVLDTDYTSYAIVWSCSFDIKLMNAQILWILMRDQNPDPQRLNYVKTLIRQRAHEDQGDWPL
ncbi:Apolipoprotein D [Penaeus vannamei]|uniref:Apolipoprotein D n=1 Tax=Penaeus vannamei TaxID=6689 RepID=A0A3R7QHU3_PENVA|nr:Apolipoprotein D [Penaeus vannamei]